MVKRVSEKKRVPPADVQSLTDSDPGSGALIRQETTTEERLASGLSVLAQESDSCVCVTRNESIGVDSLDSKTFQGYKGNTFSHSLSEVHAPGLRVTRTMASFTALASLEMGRCIMGSRQAGRLVQFSIDTSKRPHRNPGNRQWHLKSPDMNQCVNYVHGLLLLCGTHC